MHRAIATVCKGLGLVLLAGLVSVPAAFALDRQIMLQRLSFQDAEQALKRGDMTRYRELANDLRDYPLYPYLKYAEIKRNLGGDSSKDVRRFLEDYPGTPLASRLQNLWLKSLAKKRQWQTLIDNFYYSNDTALQCDFTRALFAENQPQRAYSVLQGLWLTGHALPRNCDAPVEKWYAGGGLSQDLVWERIRLAMQARQTRLAMHLARYVDKKDRYWVRMWAKVRR